MAPRGSSNWRRPYTSIYNDNYKYGTGLYSDTLTDIEKRYSDSLSKTQLRSDRRDLNFSTFADSTLTGSPSPGTAIRDISEERPSFSRQKSVPSPSGREIARTSTFESRLNAAYSSSYDIDDEVQEAINSRRDKRLQKMMSESVVEESPRPPRPTSLCLYDDATFWTLPKTTEDRSLDPDTKSKRKIGGGATTTNGPRASQWREKSRVLQDQVDNLDRKLSDCSGKLTNELSSLKSKYNNEMSGLHKSIDVTSDQTSDLQKLCKRQALQLLELQSAYDDSQRNIQDALEEMNLWRNRSKSLKKEMDKLREEVELAVHRTSKE